MITAYDTLHLPRNRVAVCWHGLDGPSRRRRDPHVSGPGLDRPLCDTEAPLSPDTLKAACWWKHQAASGTQHRF